MIVIGSGPAGMAAAWALAERGHEVTVLDAGRSPDEWASQKYAELSERPPDEWRAELVEELRQEFSVGHSKLPPKPVLGSLHPYAPGDPSAPAPGSGVGLTPSLGRGGLSAVWGAAVLPYRETDLAGWPLRLEDLAPFYGSVLEFMPVAARRDRLEVEFPLYAGELHGPAADGPDSLAALRPRKRLGSSRRARGSGGAGKDRRQDRRWTRRPGLPVHRALPARLPTRGDLVRRAGFERAAVPLGRPLPPW